MSVGHGVDLRIGLAVDLAEKAGDLLQLLIALRLAVGQQEHGDHDVRILKPLRGLLFSRRTVFFLRIEAHFAVNAQLGQYARKLRVSKPDETVFEDEQLDLLFIFPGRIFSRGAGVCPHFFAHHASPYCSISPISADTKSSAFSTLGR